ncbi:MAG: autotransporter-associated beta strand repeat-containing protein [Akkermansiaceae bacterium]|nr:autotransporter-associated beta strand repeat-containing protein [Akkermansiaceae bacterium]
MKSRMFASIATWLLAIPLLCLSGLARAQQGTYYNATLSPSYRGFVHNTRLWIPKTEATIRGVIVLGNGANGDQRNRTEETDWQALARAHDFALMGTSLYICQSANDVNAEVPMLLADLAWYATASNRPEIANLPFVLAGWSGGGQIAYGINTKIPERVIAYIMNKGAFYVPDPLSSAALKTPSIAVGGQFDLGAGRTGIIDRFDSNRLRGGLCALAVEQNAGHVEGNVNGLFFTFFDHAIRARYPAGVTPLLGPVTLLDLSESNGWLAAKPTVSGGLSGTVYPYAAYSGTKTTACWLMDADVANLYRGFATYNPAVTVTAVGGPLFSASQEIEFRVAVDSNAFPNWTSADVYDGAFKLGTVDKGGSMSVRAVRPWGGRGVTAIARDASGNERTSIPQPFVVNKNAAAAWNNGAGDFLWNTTSTNWGGAVWTSGADAVFGATGVGTVTVSGTQTLADSLTALCFDTAGYKLMGGTLALPAYPGISGFNVNVDAEIASVITGSGGLNKTGAGTLTLTGSNTHTGMTAVKAGSLKLGNGGNLTNTWVPVFSSGTLAIRQNASGTSNGLNYLTLYTGANFTMADTFTSIVNVGGARLSSGDVNAASPVLTFDIATANQTSDRLAISGGAIVETKLPVIVTNFLAAPSDSTKTYTLITAASGLGGAAKFKLAPRNFMIGGSPYHTSLATSTDTAVILSFEAGATIPPFYWQGSIDASWKSQNSGTLNTNFTSEATGATNTFELPSSVSDVFMVANSAGNLNTTLDQAFTINGLTFTGTGSSNTAGSSIGAGSGGTLQINNGGITVNSGSGANTISAPVTLGAAQSWTNNSTNLLTLGTGAVSNGGFPLTVAGSGNMAISGAISGNGSLTHFASGTLTLSGNSTYTGNTTIRSGNLSVSIDANLGNGGGIILNGGTLQTTGSSAFSSSRAISVTGNSTIDASNASGTTLTGVLTSSGGLTKKGSGSLTFSPGTGYTDTLTGLKIVSGAVNLTSGNFSVTGSGWQDASLGLSLNGGNLTVDGGALSTVGYVVLNNGALTVASGTYASKGSLQNAYWGIATTTVSGGLFDIDGVLRVSAGNGTGTVNLDDGTLKLWGFQGGNPTSTGTVNFNGATVQAKISTTDFTQAANTTYNVKSGGAIIDTAGFNITAPAALLAGSPSGGLTKNGTGTLTLSGSSTYTGATTINAGALSVSTDVNLGSGGAITLNGGTLQTTGSSAFSSSRAISVTGNSTIDTSNTAGTTLTGLVSGGSALTKTGSGNLTFSPGVGNTDTLVGFKLTSGQVNINSGAFNITGTEVQSSTSGLWLNGGNLTVAGGALSTTGYVTLQTGTLTVSSGTYISNAWLLNAYGGTATTTVSGGLIDIGGIRVSQGVGTVNLDGGTVKLSQFQSVGFTGTVNFNGASVLARANATDFTQTANTTYNVKSGGAIFDTAGFNITAAANLRAGSPSGGLTKNGAGTLTLTGNNTYTGLTNVTAGTLQLDGSVASNLTVQAGGRLIGSGSIGGNLTVASGGIAQFSGGTFAVNGSITNNGLIIFSNGARFTGNSSSFVNNGTLDVINAGTFTPPQGFQNNGVIIDANSVRVTSVSRSSNNVTVRINSNTGHTYQLQHSPTLNGGSFVNIGLPQTGSTGTILEFTASSSAGSGFYRVAVNP